MFDLHRVLLRSAVDVMPLQKRTLSGVLQKGPSIAEPADRWRQCRVLERRPTKLISGLDRTKAEPISVPTAS